MKASELSAGKVYVGKNELREILVIIRDGHSLVRYAWQSKSDTGTGSCTAPEFARWAEREATPEEAAP